MATLHASLEIFAQTSLEDIFRKSARLTGFLASLLVELAEDLQGAACPITFTCITPPKPEERGSQLSLLFASDGGPDVAQQIHDQLAKEGIVIDHRRPNVLRVSPAALYNTFSEMLVFQQKLREVVLTHARGGLPEVSN